MTMQDELSELWDSLEGEETYQVLDDEGVNMAGAMVRLLDANEGTWLYVDEVDGYRVIGEADFDRLNVGH